MTTSSLVSEPVWCTSKGDGKGGREGKSQRREKGMDACNKNPLSFISVAAGICNLLIGWTTLSNLLRCIKITIKNNKKQPWCRHQKNCGLLAQALEDQNLCRWSSDFTFKPFALFSPLPLFVPATQAISVHNRHFGHISPSQVSWFCWHIPRHHKQDNPLICHKPVNIFWLGVTYILRWDWLLGSHHHLIWHSKHLDYPSTILERRWK